MQTTTSRVKGNSMPWVCCTAESNWGELSVLPSLGVPCLQWGVTAACSSVPGPEEMLQGAVVVGLSHHADTPLTLCYIMRFMLMGVAVLEKYLAHDYRA